MKRFFDILLIIIATISGLFFLKYYNDTTIVLKIISKIIPTAFMCIWLILGNINKNNWYVLVGIFFSMLCDIFMAFDGSVFVTFAIASNLVGLIFYSINLIRLSSKLDIQSGLPGLIAIGILYLVLFDYLGSQRIPGFIYCFAYIIFFWRASSLYGKNETPRSIRTLGFFGGFLLTASDFLLSLILFDVIPYLDKYYYTVMLLWWSGLFSFMLLAGYQKRESSRSFQITK